MTKLPGSVSRLWVSSKIGVLSSYWLLRSESGNGSVPQYKVREYVLQYIRWRNQYPSSPSTTNYLLKQCVAGRVQQLWMEWVARSSLSWWWQFFRGRTEGCPFLQTLPWNKHLHQESLLSTTVWRNQYPILGIFTFREPWTCGVGDSEATCVSNLSRTTMHTGKKPVSWDSWEEWKACINVYRQNLTRPKYLWRLGRSRANTTLVVADQIVSHPLLPRRWLPALRNVRGRNKRPIMLYYREEDAW